MIRVNEDCGTESFYGHVFLPFRMPDVDSPPLPAILVELRASTKAFPILAQTLPFL